MLIPHGIYDPARNRGHINQGLSHDTSQFVGDNLKWYWNAEGREVSLLNLQYFGEELIVPSGALPLSFQAVRGGMVL